MLQGIGASKGIGIGNVIRIIEKKIEYTPYTPTNRDAEIKRVQDAIAQFEKKTKKMVEDVRDRLGDKEAEILEGQIHMINDPAMSEEIEGAIKQGSCAEEAVSQVCDSFIAMFSSIEDDMMRQRAADISDIKIRVVKILLGIEELSIDNVPANTILVVEELTPSMAANIVKENVVGIITEVGGKTSHSAILARALEIPAVLSVPKCNTLLSDGQKIVLDGEKGEVLTQVTEEQLKQYQEKKTIYEKDKKELEKFRGQKTVTKDGIELELFANIGKSSDAVRVSEFDGEGVGLFRTEFLFMDATSIPSEEAQFKAYKDAAETLHGKTVIIRTLDVGGDKEISYLGMEREENPFLGYRAIRFCLDREDVYKPQLRALLRASAYGEIRIMIPLVTRVEEIRQVKAKLEEYKKELDAEGIAYNKEIKIGVMMETPAASIIADLLAKEADFFSIGTNDLTQYTMAVDRGNAKLAKLYSVFHPAVLRSIQHIIECGNQANIMVGMCGEAAADPLLIPLLVGFGLDEFSVSTNSILATRREIARVDFKEAKILAEGIGCLTTEEEVMEYLKGFYGQHDK